MNKISPLLAVRADHDLHVAGVGEDWKVILGLVGETTMVGATGAMSPAGRVARHRRWSTRHRHRAIEYLGLRDHIGGSDSTGGSRRTLGGHDQPRRFRNRVRGDRTPDRRMRAFIQDPARREVRETGTSGWSGGTGWLLSEGFYRRRPGVGRSLSCGGFPTAANPRRAKQTGESSLTVRSSKRVSEGTEGVEAESQVVGPEMKNDNKGKGGR